MIKGIVTNWRKNLVTSKTDVNYSGSLELEREKMYKRKAFISLLIGIFLLSGCGQSGNPLTQTAENDVDEKINTNITEADENSESYEGLREPLEVRVNTQAEDVHYYNEDGIDLLRAVHRCVSDGENIYFAYYEPDLYVMPIGADEHSPANLDNPKGLNVCNIAIDTYGRIHLLMASQNNDEWFIWRLDKDYRIDKIVDISVCFETKQSPFWFLIDKDGTYYFQWLMERNGIVVDSEGALKHKFTLQSLGVRWTYEAAVGKNGQIYLIYGNSEDEKREIGEFDVQNGSIKKVDSPLYFGSNETFAEMSGGTDTNLLLYSPISGVWAYDKEQGIMENRVPLSDVGFDIGTDFWPLTFLPDGRLLLVGQTVNDSDTDKVDLLLKYLPAGK